MTKRATTNVLVTLLVAVCMMVSACNGSSSSNQTGSLSVGITDAASDDYKAIYVTIDEVQVHQGDGETGTWLVVADPGRTYNLLELVNGVIEQFGLAATLATGQYTQVRLIIGTQADGGQNILDETHPFANYIIDSGDNYHELTIPSGYNTGIKLVHPFEITAGLTTDLVLDFDADQSVVKANSGNWLLKPTIKVIDTVENAIVDGVITDGEDAPQEGVLISAQVYDPETDRVSVYTSTLTDEYGEYLLYLEPGTYSLVAYKDGFAPACFALEASINGDYEHSFTLDAASMGTITCTASTTEDAVTIQFLQESPCEPGKQIVVKSVQVVPGGPYDIDLPEGSYRIVASNGTTTVEVSSAATGGSTVELVF